MNVTLTGNRRINIGRLGPCGLLYYLLGRNSEPTTSAHELRPRSTTCTVYTSFRHWLRRDISGLDGDGFHHSTHLLPHNQLLLTKVMLSAKSVIVLVAAAAVAKADHVFTLRNNCGFGVNMSM